MAISKLFEPPHIWEDIAGSYSFNSNLKSSSERQKMVHVRTPLVRLFLIGKYYKTLPVSDQNYLKYCIFAVVTLFYLFQDQEYSKRLARGKLFDLPYLWKGIAGSYSFHFRFKNYQIKVRNWFMQELLWYFFP